MNNEEIEKKWTEALERRRRQLIVRAIVLVIRLVFEIGVLAAIVWLVYKQCSN